MWIPAKEDKGDPILAITLYTVGNISIDDMQSILVIALSKQLKYNKVVGNLLGINFCYKSKETKTTFSQARENLQKFYK